MKLALKELRRRPGRFASATAILMLIALLLMFLGGLLDGLIRSATGAVRAQQADGFVFNTESRASFLRGRVEPDVRAKIDAAGVGDVGGLGVVLLGARVPGNGPRDIANVAVWGYELSTATLPSPPPEGRAYADELLRGQGVGVGDTLLVGPQRSPITVIGWVDDTAYNGEGGLWVSEPTWREVLAANRPAAALDDGVFQALVVRSSPDATNVIDAIRRVAPEVLALDANDTIDQIPGVKEQRSTFNQILGVTVVIALVIVALFFALLTVERASLYGVLKAIGARSRTIFAGLIVQAVVLTAIAAIIAGVAVLLIDAAIGPDTIPLYVSPGRIAISVVLMLLAAIIGSAFSLRRVLRVDPASALGGA